MLTRRSDISWGSYSGFSGPFYHGSRKFDFSRVTPDSSETDKRISVLCATESGSYDAVNMYDRCIMTNGMIQFCDASMFGVCNMLGECSNDCPDILEPIHAQAYNCGYTFDRSSGAWRFRKNDGTLVNAVDRQRELYLGDSDGKSWNSEADKIRAKDWAVAVANAWETQEARDAQTRYVAARLLNFIMADVRKSLFAQPEGSNIVLAARAAYLSFAANLPAVAAEQYAKVYRLYTFGTMDWLVAILRQLTFGPGIAIYPKRFNAIRPHLESLYGIDLPDTADLLAHNDHPVAAQPVHHLSPLEVQKALLAAGYDLGPRGADGIFGAKTTQALREFQSAHGLQPDGILGPKTEAEMLPLLSATP